MVTIGMVIGQATRYSKNNRFRDIIILSLLIFCLISCNSSRNAVLQQYTTYDRLSNLYVLVFTDKMPRYNGGYASFISEFNKNFHYNKVNNKNLQTKIKFQFVINKKGKLVGARIYNKGDKDLTDFEKAGLDALTKIQNWSPGKFQNKKVNVLLTLTIHIDLY